MSEPSPPANVGDQIKKRREEAHLSLSALAARANVSKGYLWSLEKGDSNARPSGRTLYRIAEALGTTMSDLLDRDLLVDLPEEEDLPVGLEEFAKDQNLTERDIRMLSAINFRGQHPRDPQAWSLVWSAIRASVR
jgi:transcriptional regulator with XRE-family HTH domain